jgi:hypothetical protein
MHRSYYQGAIFHLVLLIVLQVFVLIFLGNESFSSRLLNHGWSYTLSIPFITFLLGWANALIVPVFRREGYRSSGDYRTVWMVYALLNLMALLLSWFFLGQFFALLAIWVFAALFLYNWKIRLWPITGNIIISVVPSVSVLALRFAFNDLPYMMLMFFAVFTFLFQFLTSWASDLSNARTSAEAGSFNELLSPETRMRWFQILVVFVLSLMLIYVNLLRQYFFGPMEWIFVAYVGLCVFLPLAMLLFKFDHRISVNDGRWLSNRLMYTKVVGIATLLLF